MTVSRSLSFEIAARNPMAIEHHFVGAQRLVITVCSGLVSRDDVVASLWKLSHHPAFRPDFRELTDLSRVSKLDLSLRDMSAIRRDDDPFSNKGRRAVVAPAQSAVFALAREYRSLVKSEHFEVFQSVLNAITWLGLETLILKGNRSKPRNYRQTPIIREIPTIICSSDPPRKT
jgi:hypothetical protein